jgi:hypothetical protein
VRFTFCRPEGFDLFPDMIALCKRRERQRPRTRSVRIEDDHADNLPKLDPEDKPKTPLPEAPGPIVTHPISA